MEMSHLKTQIMTMFMLKGSQGHGQGGQGGQGGDIFTIVYSMMLMSIVEVVLKHAPQLISFIQTTLLGRFKPKREAWMPLLDKTTKEKEQLNSISMSRLFSEDSEKNKMGNVYVEKVDAVLDYVCSLDSAKHVKIDTRYSLNSAEEIELTPLLKARVKETGNTEDGSIIEIVIFSKVLKVSEIRQWIDDVHTNYIFEKNNKLGNRIYYFNEVPVEPTVQVEMDAAGGPPKQTYRWDNMPKMLTFNMNEFNTSKSFGNVYGDHVNELKERLDLFINHPDWYMERGIPHSLGVMFHGVPGAGKTSTIKAIAKDTHRHIFNLSLRPYTSQRQLSNLFFNETVSVYSHDGNKQTLKIPLNRRVYVIEDIDCLTDVVLDRTITGGKHNRVDGDAVTLSFLLNLLDGVLETPGRILVITSNFPDKLDRALVRPGRIDVQIEFTNANRVFILDMINKFYSIEYSLWDIPEELDNVFTPAEIMESMCTHFKQPDNAIAHMMKKMPAKKASAHGTPIDFSPQALQALATQESQQVPLVPLESQDSQDQAPQVSQDSQELQVTQDSRESQVPHVPIVSKLPKVPAQVVDRSNPVIHKANAPLKMVDVEYGWAGANFTDAEFLPGGKLPGEHPGSVRSPVDLNLR